MIAPRGRLARCSPRGDALFCLAGRKFAPAKIVRMSPEVVGRVWAGEHFIFWDESFGPPPPSTKIARFFSPDVDPLTVVVVMLGRPPV